jgi:hypothetical protein
MKKHELAAEIEKLKTVKAAPAPVIEPAKPGPLGPRTIATTVLEKSGISMKVPEVPKVRIVRKSDSIKFLGSGRINFDDNVISYPLAPQPPAPTAVAEPAAPPTKPHRCNCSSCPIKAAVKFST